MVSGDVESEENDGGGREEQAQSDQSCTAVEQQDSEALLFEKDDDFEKEAWAEAAKELLDECEAQARAWQW